MSAATLPVLPENPGWLARWRTGMQCLLILKDDPANPEAGALVNEALDLPAYVERIPELQADPDGRRILAERPSLQAEDLDLEALAALPEGTLGHELAAYYARMGIAPFNTRQATEKTEQYISKRYRETHDLYHVVTGYGVDVVGEMELQAFCMGNIGIRSPRLMLPFGFLGARLSDEFIGAAIGESKVGIGEYYARVYRAYKRGQRARLMLSVPFEDHWERPVTELRAEWIDEN